MVYKIFDNPILCSFVQNSCFVIIVYIQVVGKSCPPVVSINITCRIWKYTFVLQIISAIVSCTTLQHCCPFFIYIFIKNVETHAKFEHFSWKFYPSPALHCVFEFYFNLRQASDLKVLTVLAWFNKRRQETRIDINIFTNEICLLASFHWNKKNKQTNTKKNQKTKKTNAEWQVYLWIKCYKSSI